MAIVIPTELISREYVLQLISVGNDTELGLQIDQSLVPLITDDTESEFQAAGEKIIELLDPDFSVFDSKERVGLIRFILQALDDAGAFEKSAEDQSLQLTLPLKINHA